jgi:hypothetical protein
MSVKAVIGVEIGWGGAPGKFRVKVIDSPGSGRLQL